MSSSFSCPEMPAVQIAKALTDSGIFTVREEDIVAPTSDFACALYSSILDTFQPLRDGSNTELDFATLQLLDNPEHHEHAVNAINISHRMKQFLTLIKCDGFRLFDILKPERRRMILFLSAVVNFIYYREEKLAKLQAFMDELPVCGEKRSELQYELAELNKQIMDHEDALKKEEPMVHEVTAEVNQLKQSIQEYNEQEILMKNQVKELNEKVDAIDNKIAQSDLEILKKEQEKSKLLSEVVQSPYKLQKDLEEKRKKLAEVKNSERLAIQSVQEKSANLEIYLKAYNKISKILRRVQATQEEINSAKSLEKEVKILKAKLNNDAASDIALDSKLLELQLKAKRSEELLRAREQEMIERRGEDIRKLEDTRAMVEHGLKQLEGRERNIEEIVAQSDSYLREAESIKEAGKAEQQKLLSKMEEIVYAYREYSKKTKGALLTFQSELMPSTD